jgi:hypothetical protein
LPTQVPVSFVNCRLSRFSFSSRSNCAQRLIV